MNSKIDIWAAHDLVALVSSIEPWASMNSDQQYGFNLALACVIERITGEVSKELDEYEEYHSLLAESYAQMLEEQFDDK